MPTEDFAPYVATQIVVITTALLVAVVRRRELRCLTRDYGRQLLDPLRLALFACALFAFTALASTMGDPTWDWIDGGFMATGCYLLAPWSVGVVTRAVTRRERAASEIALALVAWVAVSSWSYDLYLLARDGEYPITWDANLQASPILYALGGLFFSAAWDRERGVTLAFLHPEWPRWSGDPGGLLRMWPLLVVLALPVAFLFGAFWLE